MGNCQRKNLEFLKQEYLDIHNCHNKMSHNNMNKYECKSVSSQETLSSSKSSVMIDNKTDSYPMFDFNNSSCNALSLVAANVSKDHCKLSCTSHSLNDRNRRVSNSLMLMRDEINADKYNGNKRRQIAKTESNIHTRKTSNYA